MLPWQGATLAEYHVEQLQGAGVRDIEVVLGCDADSVLPLVAADNVEPIVDYAWQHDVSSAWRVGATAVPRGTTAAVIMDVLCPRQASLIRAVIDAQSESRAEMTRASFAGRHGWPIIAGGAMLAQIRNVADDGALGAVLNGAAARTMLVPWIDDAAVFRIETADDLR